jgi:hypothetical protein
MYKCIRSKNPRNTVWNEPSPRLNFRRFSAIRRFACWRAKTLKKGLHFQAYLC